MLRRKCKPRLILGDPVFLPVMHHCYFMCLYELSCWSFLVEEFNQTDRIAHDTAQAHTQGKSSQWGHPIARPLDEEERRHCAMNSQSRTHSGQERAAGLSNLEKTDRRMFLVPPLSDPARCPFRKVICPNFSNQSCCRRNEFGLGLHHQEHSGFPTQRSLQKAPSQSLSQATKTTTNKGKTM